MSPIAGFLILASVTSPSALAQLKITWVANSASFGRDARPVDGSGVPWGGRFGDDLLHWTHGNAGVVTAATAKPLPFQLAGITVTVNGAYAPILAVYIPPDPTSVGQINIQVPLERNATLDSVGATDRNGVMVVTQNSLSLTTGDLGAANLNGGFFSDGNGYVVAQHVSDGTPVTMQNPAHAGETIAAFADNFYTVWPPPPIGFPATSDVPFRLQLKSVYCCGLYFDSGTVISAPALQVTSIGLAPGLVGVEKIVFVVPPDQQPNDWPLFLNFTTPNCVSSVVCIFASLPLKLPVR